MIPEMLFLISDIDFTERLQLEGRYHLNSTTYDLFENWEIMSAGIKFDIEDCRIVKSLFQKKSSYSWKKIMV